MPRKPKPDPPAKPGKDVLSQIGGGKRHRWENLMDGVQRGDVLQTYDVEWETRVQELLRVKIDLYTDTVVWGLLYPTFIDGVNQIESKESFEFFSLSARAVLGTTVNGIPRIQNREHLYNMCYRSCRQTGKDQLPDYA
eukprot:PhF_6_TR31475/c4_g4_i1/m.46256